jgi:hypothetical protein
LQVVEGAQARRSVVAVGRRRLAILVLVLGLAMLASQPPASATETRVRDTQRLLGDVQLQRLEVRLSDGSLARGDVIRFPETAPGVELRSHLARGTVAGTETMATLASRVTGQGGIAGINGGYRFPRDPWGAPNGLFVDRGRLEQGQAVNRRGDPTGRGMVGWGTSNRLVMDRIQVTHAYTRRAFGLPPAAIDELNRQPWRATGEVLLYTDRFGTAIQVPAESTVVVLTGLQLASTGTSTGEVLRVQQVTEPIAVTVAPGEHVLVGTGPRSVELADLSFTEPIDITTTITPEATPAGAWDALSGGVAGGQLLVRDGQRRPVEEWVEFAAFGSDHALARQPRTAIGRTGRGEVLLVTVDGRQPGWSVGLTVRELADVLLALGARDAVNLDGGGSTAMVVQGRTRNRPSETGRAVMDGIFVHVPQPPAERAYTTACSTEVVLVDLRFVDVPGTTHELAIGCLATWRVTTGVTPTTYEPAGAVTRAQMASFLSRWIDDHAARGTGRPLPTTAANPFLDVAATSAHAEAIARLSAAGVISGRTPSSFAPAASVTRAQTATMVAQAIEHSLGVALPTGRDTFVDDNGSVHESTIDRLAAFGIVTGVGGFDYRPDAPVSRGAMASILMRATGDLVDRGVAVPPGDGPVLAGVDEPTATAEG